MSKSQEFHIRLANLDDVDPITEIFNEAILNTTASFYTEPRTSEQQLQWFYSHDDRHPILVAEINGVVVGWAGLSAWSDRPAYNDTAETSFYVKSEHQGQGIGRALKQAIIEQARQLAFHTLIAGVAEESLESFHLNTSFGFQQVGTLRQVGRKFGKLLDVHIFQLILD